MPRVVFKRAALHEIYARHDKVEITLLRTGKETILLCHGLECLHRTRSFGENWMALGNWMITMRLNKVTDYVDTRRFYRYFEKSYQFRWRFKNAFWQTLWYINSCCSHADIYEYRLPGGVLKRHRLASTNDFLRFHQKALASVRCC